MAVKKFSLEAVIDLTDRMTAPMQRMEKGMAGFSKKMQKSFGGVGKDIKALDSGINKAAIGIGVAGVAAIAGISMMAEKASSEWGMAQSAIASVEATLKSTGGTVGRSLEQLEAQAKSLQKNTFIGDDAIMQGVTSQMLTFTNITGTAFDRAQIAVVDVAAKLNGLNTTQESLKSTTIALSKALNDPIANLGALSRSGIQFSKSQKDMIAGMVKHGKLADAQSLILTEIEKQYGGTAAAITKTTAGLKLQSQNLTGDAWEDLGRAIDPVMQKLLLFKNKVLEKITPLIQKFGTYIEQNMEKISKAIDSIDIEKIISNVFKFIDAVKSVIDFLSPLAPIILGLVVAVKAVTAVMTVFNAIMWIVSLNPVSLTILGIVVAIVAVTLIVSQVVKHFDFLKSILLAVGQAIGGFFVDQWNKALGVLSKVGGFFMNIGQSLMKWMLTPINMVLDALGWLISMLSKIPGLAGKLGPAAAAIDKMQGQMNNGLTGAENAYDYGTIWNDGYSNPDTRVSESRTSSTSTTRTAVDLYAPSGFGMSPRGGTGAPKQTLSLGAAQ